MTEAAPCGGWLIVGALWLLCTSCQWKSNDTFLWISRRGWTHEKVCSRNLLSCTRVWPRRLLGQRQGSGWQGESAGRPDKGLIGLSRQILWKWRPPLRRSLFLSFARTQLMRS